MIPQTYEEFRAQDYAWIILEGLYLDKEGCINPRGRTMACSEPRRKNSLFPG
jgi:hypothetical protein